MTYRQRLTFFIITDSLVLVTAIFFSQFFLDEGTYGIGLPLVFSAITLLLSHHLQAWAYKLYKKAWEYASAGEFFIITKVITFSIMTTACIQFLIIHDIHYRLLTVTWMLHLLLIGGSRLIWRIFRDHYKQKGGSYKRTLIIGAGSAGTMLGRQLQSNRDTELLPIAFIDDDAKKHDLHILGIPVVGGVGYIEQAAHELAIDHIVIAIPSLSRKELNHIYSECAKTNAKTQIIPMLEHLATGRVSVNEFRDVQVEDLLGREPVELDIGSISEYMTNKVVLVTGAGGSIGSEICRQISKFKPEKLILLGHGENSIYSIEMELKELYKDTKIKFIPEIADLRDVDKMMSVMRTYSPHVVYHAAAHKHVPLMETTPDEAVKNNIIGTLNVARAANLHKVETFVMISTDKAVNPTSVMGATKRIAEMVIQYMDKISSTTRFVTVRFGNVLGSNGSVIPLFKKQIEKGGPVTVTHPDMLRYFMTIPEASRLVIQAGALAKGGEIFVLDMGEPVKILDLAKNMIKLSGYTVDEIGVEFTGIRPGEKLFEELLKEGEIQEQQVYPKIYIGKSSEIRFMEIEDILLNYHNLNKLELRNRLLDMANNKVAIPQLLSIPS